MDESRHPNPLIRQIHKLQDHVNAYRENTRNFYFDVILSTVKCPKCGSRLKMAGQSRCRCQCGLVLDPTIKFQKSPCCGSQLIHKVFHYACSVCGKTVASRFIFNERIFDKAYFRQMMQSCREKRKQKLEKMRKLFAGCRSDPLQLVDSPELNEIPGLSEDLDTFISSEAESGHELEIDISDSFKMEFYRKHILSELNWDPVDFSNISPLTENRNKDRARRFITLIFMQNENEVKIEQQEKDLLIQKVYNEAHC